MQLPINSIDFYQIKQNFITYLKQQNRYTDYNFDASGISSLINLFAYNTHYLGYYANMALNESFIDTAQTKESLYSKAKLNGYIPQSKTGARANLSLAIRMHNNQEPTLKQIIIPKYSYFTGTNSIDDNRKFYVLDDILCTDKTIIDSNNIQYHSPDFYVTEGTLRINKFTVLGNPEQRYILKDSNIDINTIRITVLQERNSVIAIDYNLCENIFNIDKDSLVFYLTANNDGFYEVYFGQDVFGKQPIAGNIIEITYLSTSGVDGNGCKEMFYNKPSGNDSTTTSGYNNFITTINSQSYGGADAESIETLRFSIPSHYKRQNRNVLAQDFKEFIIDRYQDIESVRVWGGEEHFEKQYGSVFIAVKPKIGKYISDSQIYEIKNNAIKYATFGQTVSVINPEYISVSVSIFVKFDRKKTNKEFGEIKQIITNKIQSYNNLYMDRFDIGLSNVDLLSYIKQDNDYITRIYSSAIISKTFNITYLKNEQHIIRFGNQILPNTLNTSSFTYTNKICKVIDDGIGNMIMVDNTNTKVISRPIGTVNYQTGTIIVMINENIKINSLDINNKPYLIIFATPSKPDIETIHNNILLIEDIKVIENA
ncbi:MAG: hypothetical protein PHC28_13885 [Flavobacterium sp.]|uniref:hypothetical protein n=1 Tax=Flavobacterium sp. TaxID=239 RepID=UPI002603E097|nr:hypothetical protein [Flavobacterium sp.]MDD5151544.1 hypothetical protein [Flavobacterium sp.]